MLRGASAGRVSVSGNHESIARHSIGKREVVVLSISLSLRIGRQNGGLKPRLNHAFSCSNTLAPFEWAVATHAPAFKISFVFETIGFA